MLGFRGPWSSGAHLDVFPKQAFDQLRPVLSQSAVLDLAVDVVEGDAVGVDSELHVGGMEVVLGQVGQPLPVPDRVVGDVTDRAADEAEGAPFCLWTQKPPYVLERVGCLHALAATPKPVNHLDLAILDTDRHRRFKTDERVFG